MMTVSATAPKLSTRLDIIPSHSIGFPIQTCEGVPLILAHTSCL